MAVAALVISILALLLAIWSAWSTHRSARSSEASARSAAEAVALEHERRHDELAPRITLLRDTLGRRTGAWAILEGPTREEPIQVSVAIIEREGGGPIDALSVGSDHPGPWKSEADLGHMVAGDKRFLRFRRPRNRRGGIVRLRFTCTTDRDTWTLPAECELPAPAAGRVERYSDPSAGEQGLFHRRGSAFD
jgi:hypothetical protein